MRDKKTVTYESEYIDTLDQLLNTMNSNDSKNCLQPIRLLHSGLKQIINTRMWNMKRELVESLIGYGRIRKIE